MDEARRRARSSSSSSSSVKTDRLGNLPEPLIDHVLSFLDTKHVVQTSVLARKWRYIWTSLPFLNFGTHAFQDSVDSNKAFTDFVDRVLILRDNSTIHTFSLIWDDDYCNPSRIDSWIRFAICGNVQQLHIQFHPREDVFELPDCLFTSNSLTSLKLTFPEDFFTTKVVPPRQINLHSLKTLHLKSIDFSSYDDFFDNLCLGCPAMETLILVACEFTKSKILTISAPQLKHLVIKMCYTLCDDDDKGAFVVSAPNLINFLWRDFMSIECSLQSLSALQIAKLEIEGGGYGQVIPKDGDVNPFLKNAKRMIKCLKGLYNVTYLTLSAPLLQVYSELPSELENWLTPFSNLRYLHLETWLTRGCFQAIMFLLENSRNVETLILDMDLTEVDSANIAEQGVGESSLKPKLYHLKFVEFRKVAGCSNELEYVKVLLENAVTLKKMTIFTSRRRVGTDERLFKEFKKEVFTIPRASSDASINFC